MKKNQMKSYKMYERKNENVLVLRKHEVASDKIISLANQSQAIDFIKHNIVDKMLMKSVDINKVANAINEIVCADSTLISKFFSHAKYEKTNAILLRIKAHLAVDTRHKETRFDKRQVAIASQLK